jgi:hypothetical protein
MSATHLLSGLKVSAAQYGKMWSQKCLRHTEHRWASCIPRSCDCSCYTRLIKQIAAQILLPIHQFWYSLRKLQWMLRIPKLPTPVRICQHVVADNPEAVVAFLVKWAKGHFGVQGVAIQRGSQSKITASLGYIYIIHYI